MFYFITLVILFGTSSITANLDLQCQQGWHKYANDCFWFSDFNASRDNAKLECESRESTLVTIDSNATNSFLKQHITGNMSYWIGLRMDNIAISAWRWNTGGPLIFQPTLHWCESSNDPFTACAVMTYYEEPCLKSYTCTQFRPFICEKVVADVSLCPSHWQFYTDGTGRCYYSDENRMTRMEAARYCYDIGGRLVTVPSYLTKIYLTKNRPTTDNVHWVGLSPYKWDDGTPYNWNNWDYNGPHIGEQCTRLLQSGLWTYGDCTNVAYNFVCQKGATMLPSTSETTTSSTSAISDTHSETTPHMSTASRIVEHVDYLSTFGETINPTINDSDIRSTIEITTIVDNSSTCSCAVARRAHEEVEKKYLIIIGVLAVVCVCFLGAIVGIIIYFKRQMKLKKPQLPSQGIQYEDVSAAYYNVGADINKSCDVKIYENRDQNIEKQQQNITYEELTTVNVPKAEPGPYAVLK